MRPPKSCTAMAGICAMVMSQATAEAVAQMNITVAVLLQAAMRHSTSFFHVSSR